MRSLCAPAKWAIVFDPFDVGNSHLHNPFSSNVLAQRSASYLSAMLNNC